MSNSFFLHFKAVSTLWNRPAGSTTGYLKGQSSLHQVYNCYACWCSWQIIIRLYNTRKKETEKEKLKRQEALLSLTVSNRLVNNLPRWRPPSQWASRRAASRSWPVSGLFSFVWDCRDSEGAAAAWEGVLCGPWTGSRWWVWCSWGTPWLAWVGPGAAQLHWTES